MIAGRMKRRHAVAAVIVAVVVAAGVGAALSSSDPSERPAPTAPTASPGGVSTVTATASPTVAAAGAPRPTTGPGGCAIAAPAAAPSGLTLYVCFSMSGAVTASGGFIDSDQGAGASSCADWAEDAAEAPGSASAALQAPDPGDAQVTVGGQDLGFDLVIEPYTGPGTYPSTTVAESVSLDDTASWSSNSTTAATFTAEVSPDGSGSLSVSDLHNDSSNGTTENASESWVCVMEPAS
jgi:hypothetical protein